MIISVVGTKIWYLKNVQFLFGHPVYEVKCLICQLSHKDENRLGLAHSYASVVTERHSAVDTVVNYLTLNKGYCSVD